MGPVRSPVRTMLFFPNNWSARLLNGLPGKAIELPELFILIIV